jgi:diguanylate cyclase (GGDEF)-like protein/PAS domain S-box-containing protein
MLSFLRHQIPSGSTLPLPEWDRRHRGILILLWILAVAVPAYGLARGHALTHDIVGCVTLAVSALCATAVRARRSASSMASLGLCTACALTVHLANGAIEAHFTFFVMIIVVSLYEDWRPFLIAFAFVVVHHGLMGAIAPETVYDHAGNPWALAAIHGGFVLLASIAAVVSWRLNEELRHESVRTSELARESDARFRSAFEDGPVCMALVGAGGPTRGTLVRINRTLCERFGYAEHEIAGAHVAMLFDAAGRATLLAAVDELIGGRATVCHDEVVLLDSAGDAFDGRVTTSLVLGRDGVRDVILQIEDVTERNRLERELHDLADLDSLTGLYNRRRFERELSGHLDAATRSPRGGAVILIDLDNFKTVNDTLSHQAGDEMLVAAAEALSERTRATDVVARLGGDEFAVLIPDANPAEAAIVGHALVERIGERAVHHGGAVMRRTTASIGVVVFGADTQMTGDQLLNDADLAMYEAKDDGGNRCVVYSSDPPAGGAPGSYVSWPDRIRRALDDERLTLFAQPILDIQAGEITRYELLLRMLSDNGDVISPGAFLPVAERRGMIGSIDRWVVRTAIALLDRCAKEVRLQVNISARSLSDPDFLVYIRSELAAAGADPSKLVFEVTETAAIANVDDARRLLTRLADLGCGIAIDDFGAGFASFYYLMNLPFDELKIDGQFIRNLTTNPDDLVLVQTLVQLAHGLGKHTVAEYVEDAETLELVRRLGVDFAQGYHVGRPSPAAALLAQGVAPRVA